jgi:hypothetical protein
MISILVAHYNFPNIHATTMARDAPVKSYRNPTTLFVVSAWLLGRN